MLSDCVTVDDIVAISPAQAQSALVRAVLENENEFSCFLSSINVFTMFRAVCAMLYCLMHTRKIVLNDSKIMIQWFYSSMLPLKWVFCFVKLSMVHLLFFARALVRVHTYNCFYYYCHHVIVSRIFCRLLFDIRSTFFTFISCFFLIFFFLNLAPNFSWWKITER